MRKLEKYTGQKTYMYPNGKLASPQIMEEDYPALKVFGHIIETDESSQVCFAIENLAAMRTRFNIESSLSDDEAISKIEEKLNEVPEEEVSPEERIAAALEYQNLLSM